VCVLSFGCPGSPPFQVEHFPLHSFLAQLFLPSFIFGVEAGILGGIVSSHVVFLGFDL
jgi:hypothetical protein